MTLESFRLFLFSNSSLFSSLCLCFHLSADPANCCTFKTYPECDIFSHLPLYQSGHHSILPGLLKWPPNASLWFLPFFSFQHSSQVIFLKYHSNSLFKIPSMTPYLSWPLQWLTKPYTVCPVSYVIDLRYLQIQVTVATVTCLLFPGNTLGILSPGVPPSRALFSMNLCMTHSLIPSGPPCQWGLIPPISLPSILFITL